MINLLFFNEGYLYVYDIKNNKQLSFDFKIDDNKKGHEFDKNFEYFTNDKFAVTEYRVINGNII